MQVPHKGGNYPMCRPLNNVYESDTNHGKVVDQREALPELPKNTNTQRKATKRDKSIQYEVKKTWTAVIFTRVQFECRISPKEHSSQRQSNKIL